MLIGFIIRRSDAMTTPPLTRRCAVILSLVMTCAAGAGAAPTTDWAAIAKTDFQFTVDTFRKQHAGIAAGELSVVAPFEAGTRLGQAEAATVRTEQDYLRLMQRFISAFGDPHTGIDLHLQTRGWTGLVLDQAAGGYRVVWSEPGWPNALPPAGAIAQQCDGVWTGTYLQTRVAPFMNRSVEYAATFSTLARQMMLDLGLGWTPQQCVFTLPDGSRKRYDLPLHAVPAQLGREQVDAVLAHHRAAAKPVGVTPLGADKHWVGMPDFNGARSGAAYSALYPQLAALPKSGWIVFDLRGNGGGDSSWGNRALRALYGEAYAEQLSAAGGTAKYLVANAASAALLKHYIDAPEFADSKADNQRDLLAVQTAMQAGAKLALVSGDAKAATLTDPTWPRPHGPRIAAVIDRSCFSSCMNFLQQLQASGDSIVLGEPTIGYSPFGEITTVALPSGRGTLRVPTAWFKTAQATREPFVPDIPYPGNMADDAALMAWVNATLDALKR